MPEQLENDPMDEFITLSQASKEFKVKHKTLNVWVWSGKIQAREEHDELNHKYYMVKRGDVSQFLNNRSNRGRPLKPTT